MRFIEVHADKFVYKCYEITSIAAWQKLHEFRYENGLSMLTVCSFITEHRSDLLKGLKIPKIFNFYTNFILSDTGSAALTNYYVCLCV
jgi:hypothetical protein